VNAWARSFVAYGVYGLGLGTLYYALTDEWVGSILLWLIGVAPLLVVAYAVRRRIFRPPPPEDQPDATPADAAGEDLGEFPTSSAWPLFLVLGALTTGAALVYGLLLLPLGLGVIAWAVVGLMRESRG
jgi:hypothetical protein